MHGSYGAPYKTRAARLVLSSGHHLKSCSDRRSPTTKSGGACDGCLLPLAPFLPLRASLMCSCSRPPSFQSFHLFLTMKFILAIVAATATAELINDATRIKAQIVKAGRCAVPSATVVESRRRRSAPSRS